jgi:hypothetical protein
MLPLVCAVACGIGIGMVVVVVCGSGRLCDGDGIVEGRGGRCRWWEMVGGGCITPATKKEEL